MTDLKKIKKDIGKIVEKNTYVDGLCYTHGVKPAPLCFNVKGYENFIDDLLEYIKKLLKKEK